MASKLETEFWVGEIPTACELCKSAVADDFIDGKLKSGPWVILCEACHARAGVGLGNGKGHRYKPGDDGEWVKVEG